MIYVIYVKGERGLHSLAGLQARNLMPALCVSEKDEPGIAEFCSKHSIPYVVESHPGKQQHMDLVLGYKLDLLVCAGYSKILPEVLFADLKHGAINCHGGRLPQYRGASPIPWQIIN